ncbi:MAG TPA: transposase, partial [Paracoccaceae bacterium]|nr:transposase [Paracoccaceae bacterium]
MDNSKAARNLRNRIARFSGDLSIGLCKRAQAFVGDMVYGMQASESVMLTEIGRTLEESCSLKKTEERLSRNLQRPELEDTIQYNVLRMAKNHIGRDTLLLVDPSDLSKTYAKKMEYLATVRDGSTGELSQGYHTMHIVGAELDSKRMVPLYQRLWSCDAPDFQSENVEILRGVDAVMEHVGNNGIFVYDRGGDRINLFSPFLDRKARFLVRLVGSRHLVHNKKKLLADDVARSCPCPFAQTIVRIDGEREKRYELKFGFRKVRLPERPEPLYLLVIHGFGDKPSMFLTSEPLRRSFKCLWRFVRMYTKRWSIEETIRYVKTCYDLENVRVLNYQGLQNIMPLLLAVMFFCACILDHDQRLRIMAAHIEKAAKRVFGIPDFKYYALADGL